MRKEAITIKEYIKSMKSKKSIEKLIADESFLIGFKNMIREKPGFLYPLYWQAISVLGQSQFVWVLF